MRPGASSLAGRAEHERPSGLWERVGDNTAARLTPGPLWGCGDHKARCPGGNGRRGLWGQHLDQLGMLTEHERHSLQGRERQPRSPATMDRAPRHTGTATADRAPSHTGTATRDRAPSHTGQSPESHGHGHEGQSPESHGHGHRRQSPKSHGHGHEGQSPESHGDHFSSWFNRPWVTGRGLPNLSREALRADRAGWGLP